MQHFPALPNPLAWLFGQCRANESKLQQWLAPQSHFKFLEYDIETFQAMNLPMAVTVFIQVKKFRSLGTAGCSHSAAII